MGDAPRPLGSGGPGDGNPFAIMARGGRKFKVGVCTTTRPASVIHGEVMANLAAKIILGNEMRAERDHTAGSAAQDLSDDHGTMASLDAGESIVSRVFVPFATPIKAPPFGDPAARDAPAGGRAGVFGWGTRPRVIVQSFYIQNTYNKYGM